jgi:hypothetical protein
MRCAVLHKPTNDLPETEIYLVKDPKKCNGKTGARGQAVYKELVGN